MIGKIVLTMLVAAAKINQSSIVPAFDQTRVPRIIQVLVPTVASTDTAAGKECTWRELINDKNKEVTREEI